MRTRLFWIFPFGRSGTAGGATILGSGAAVGLVGVFVSPGCAGGLFSCARVSPHSTNRIDNKHAHRLLESRHDATDQRHINPRPARSGMILTPPPQAAAHPAADASASRPLAPNAANT